MTMMSSAWASKSAARGAAGAFQALPTMTRSPPASPLSMLPSNLANAGWMQCNEDARKHKSDDAPPLHLTLDATRPSHGVVPAPPEWSRAVSLSCTFLIASPSLDMRICISTLLFSLWFLPTLPMRGLDAP